jgi:23S rRNA (uracil1939-C5)-methyltransferase
MGVGGTTRRAPVSEAVRIRAIAAGGDGVGALADGRAVFVPRSAPGDLVELTGVTLASRFARARIGRLLEPSSDRVEPACPHYDRDQCGGCQLQHLGAEAQRAARRRLVADAFRRIGHQEIAEPPLEPSDLEWGYRTRISLAVRGRRIGFHRASRPDEVFDLERCAVAREELNTLWAAVRAHRRLLPRTGERLTLRVERGGGLHLMVQVRGTEAWTGARELGRALSKAGVAVVIWWWPEGGAPRVLSGARDPYPATVFEQVHPAMGDRVRGHAVAELGDVAGRHIWDLYAGIGETTAAVLARGALVTSVEVDRRAVALAERRGPGEGVTRIAARVEDAIASLRPSDAVIVNPPRTGLDESVTRQLSVFPSLRRCVYVSCDPATLARDAARLAAGYAVASVHGFDLFPQTAHVETVVRFERR